MKRDDMPPATAPHNRTCREAFPLLLFFWWYFLAKGIVLERRTRKAAGQ